MPYAPGNVEAGNFAAFRIAPVDSLISVIDPVPLPPSATHTCVPSQVTWLAETLVPRLIDRLATVPPTGISYK